MVKAPTPEEEDRRRLCRERKVLIGERVQHVNRVKGLLFSQGISGYEPLRRDRRRRLDTLQTGQYRQRRYERYEAHLSLRKVRSKRQQVGDERVLFLLRQLRSENEVEELHRVGEGWQPAVMKIGRRVLDPAQGKGFDRPVGQRHKVVVCLADLIEAAQALGGTSL